MVSGLTIFIGDQKTSSGGLIKLTIKNKLKKFRKENNMTQKDLAKKMDVSRQTINAIETGKYNPSLELALKLAEFFETKVEKIFKLEK